MAKKIYEAKEDKPSLNGFQEWLFKQVDSYKDINTEKDILEKAKDIINEGINDSDDYNSFSADFDDLDFWEEEGWDGDYGDYFSLYLSARQIDEGIDSAIDIYNSDLLEWISKDSNNVDYVNQAVADYGWPKDGLISAIMFGQSQAIEEAVNNIIYALDQSLEKR